MDKIYSEPFHNGNKHSSTIQGLFCLFQLTQINKAQPADIVPVFNSKTNTEGPKAN